MSKRKQSDSLAQQLRQSMDDLKSIMSRGLSPSGGGQFTVRTVEVTEPSRHDSRSVRRTRRTLHLSQVLFAQLLGVSPALVRSWELGTRTPSPIARRLLDQARAHPELFTPLVRATAKPRTGRRKVA